MSHEVGELLFLTRVLTHTLRRASHRLLCNWFTGDSPVMEDVRQHLH